MLMEMVIQEPALSLWANFRQKPVDTAMMEITKKADLKIAIKGRANIGE